MTKKCKGEGRLHGVQSTRAKTQSPQPDTTDSPQYRLALQVLPVSDTLSYRLFTLKLQWYTIQRSVENTAWSVPTIINDSNLTFREQMTEKVNKTNRVVRAPL